MNTFLNGKLLVSKGFLYRGEIILTRAFEAAIIYPTWLGGKEPVYFDSANEAQAFVDAAHVMAQDLFAYQRVYTEVTK